MTKTPISEQMHADYKKYILNVAPFRVPIFDNGRGVHVTDLDGNTYLDLMSGQFCLPFGHAYEPFAKMISQQLRRLIHTNTLSLTTETLKGVKELASLSDNSLNKSILLSTGAEAVEAAIRFAKICTKKEGVVGISDGYHGLTLATQSISSGGIYAKPRVSQTYSIPTPHSSRSVDDNGIATIDYIQQAKQLLSDKKGTIAAFVVEPVISVGGMIFPHSSYFHELSKLAKDHEALLIFDECQTGLGRTGTWFGYQHYGVIPDVLVLAKIAGGGIPVSAVMVTDEVAAQIENVTVHFSSHQNDPLSGAILEFIISHMKSKKTLENVNKMGEYFLEQLISVSKTNPIIQNPRGLGLMLGFDLPSEYFIKGHNPGQELISLLEDRGVIIQAIRRGQTFRILPSYTIRQSDIDLFIEKLLSSITILKKRLKL